MFCCDKIFIVLNFQVTSLEIWFNYKNQRRFTYLWYGSTTMVSVLFGIATLFSYKIIREILPLPYLMIMNFSYIFRDHLGTYVILTYIIITRNLCLRFAALNTYLRFQYLRSTRIHPFTQFCFETLIYSEIGNDSQMQMQFN